MGLVVPGSIRVLMSDGQVTEMKLETYLAGVVFSEMGASAPLEAMKAQAVASRNYAAAAHRHPEVGADVCTTSHCQEWKQVDPVVAPEVFRAVSETWGIVAVHNGKLIDTFFFEHCNGHTRSATDLHMPAVAYLQGVDCACGFLARKGHGVGMCQRGASVMARRGASFEQILQHYYRGVVVIHTTLDRSEEIAPSPVIPSRPAPPPTPPPQPEPQVARGRAENVKPKPAVRAKPVKPTLKPGLPITPVHTEPAAPPTVPPPVIRPFPPVPAPVAPVVPRAASAPKLEPIPAPVSLQPVPQQPVEPASLPSETPMAPEEVPLPPPPYVVVPTPKLESKPLAEPVFATEPTPDELAEPVLEFESVFDEMEEPVSPAGPVWSVIVEPIVASVPEPETSTEPVLIFEPVLAAEEITPEPASPIAISEPAAADLVTQGRPVEEPSVQVILPAIEASSHAEFLTMPPDPSLVSAEPVVKSTAQVQAGTHKPLTAAEAVVQAETAEIAEPPQVPDYVQQLNRAASLSADEISLVSPLTTPAGPDPLPSLPPVGFAELPALHEPVSVKTPRVHVDHLPGARMIAGCLPDAGVIISVEDARGAKTLVFSGSAAHYGTGGFETIVAEDGRYIVTIEGEQIPVDIIGNTVFIHAV